MADGVWLILCSNLKFSALGQEKKTLKGISKTVTKKKLEKRVI